MTIKSYKEFLTEGRKFTIKKEEHYVRSRVPDGGRFIHAYKNRLAWGVYEGSKLVYGGFSGGSNTHAARAIISSKKEAQAFIDGYNTFMELGDEFAANKLAPKKGRRGPEQKAFRAGVLEALYRG